MGATNLEDVDIHSAGGDKKNIEEVFEIGQGSDQDTKTHTQEKSDNHLVLWLLGLGISFIPIALIPIYNLIMSNINFCVFADSVFGNTDVIYIGISMILTAIMDLAESGMYTKDKVWICSVFGILAIGAGLYALFEYNSNALETDNNTGLLIFNCVYLAVVVVTCVYKYIKCRKEM